MPSLVPRSGAAVLVAVALVLSGCGDADPPRTSRPAPPPSVTLSDTVPPSGLYAVAGARAVPAGATRVTVRNSTRRERGAQLVRVAPGHDATQALAALERVGEGQALPRWIDWAGGIGVLRPRSSSTFTVSLRPGRHYVIDRSYEGRTAVAPSAVTRLDVGRAAGAARLPAAGATITASEYGLQARGLSAGRGLVALRNAGRQPHDVVIAPIVAGKTLADVREFATGESESAPPVDLEREVISGVLHPGTSQTMTLDLRPGRYALLCFASDRQGGPPHVVRGMLAQTTVAD